MLKKITVNEERAVNAERMAVHVQGLQRMLKDDSEY